MRPEGGFHGHNVDVRFSHAGGASSSTLGTDGARDMKHGFVDPRPTANLRLDTTRFFVGKDRRNGLDFTHPTFRAVDRYIDNRLESFIIRANERNKELLDAKPYLRDFLPQRFEHGPGDVTEAWLLQALSRHMVEDKMEFKDTKGVYYLPFDDIQPNDNAFKNKRFGWDSEMHFAAVLHSNLEGKIELAKNSLKNAMYLFDLPGMGYVPNASARGLDDRTQPPRHTTMVRMLWDAMPPEERATPENHQFFRQVWDFAKQEYWEVFNAKDSDKPTNYSSEDPLGQSIEVDGEIFTIYGSRDVVTYHTHSALGGGWDHSKQAYRREADHSRVDLEMYLYKYEQDFAWLHEGTPEETMWKARMAQRKERVLQYNYNPETGWFNHYDFKNHRQSSVDTVTGLFGLRLLDDPQQREKMINYFEARFMHMFGVGLTDPETLPKITPQKEQAIEAFEPDPGMQITLKEEYNHEQWEGRRQFYIITKQVKDELDFAARSETNPELKQRMLNLSNQIEQTTLVGLAQYFEKKKEETGEGKLPEKLHAETGEMADGAQYGDQEELVMPFGVFKLFMAHQEARAALDRVPGGIPTIVLPEPQLAGASPVTLFAAE
jgi:hypothetical protein